MGLLERALNIGESKQFKQYAKRVAAIRALGGSNSASTKTLLLGLLERKGDAYAEPDADVRAEA